MSEFDHLTLARLLIARYRSDRQADAVREARRLLDRLLKDAQDGGRQGSAIEILVQQALACQAQGNLAEALAPLERALALAEPEGYCQTFVGEGQPMVALLQEAAKHGIAPVYVSKLLAALGEAGGRTPAAQPLIESLSERELEVLRLLRSELSGPAIARELMVSLSTLRTHTQNIYGKLGVNNRRAAVRRAQELGLL